MIFLLYAFICCVSFTIPGYHVWRCFCRTDAVESWRREKLNEVAEIIHEKTSNSTISPEEASMSFLWLLFHSLYFQLSFDDEGVLISSSLEFSEKKVISIVTLLAGLLARALEDDWTELSEEIGLWIPVQITNKEHDDKPEGEVELGNKIVSCSVQILCVSFFFVLV